MVEKTADMAVFLCAVAAKCPRGDRVPQPPESGEAARALLALEGDEGGVARQRSKKRWSAS